MKNKRYFYDTENDKIYELSDIETLFNELKDASKEYTFNQYLDAITDKNGTFAEVYNGLHLIFSTDEKENVVLKFSEDMLNECITMYNLLIMQVENVYEVYIRDGSGNVMIR